MGLGEVKHFPSDRYNNISKCLDKQYPSRLSIQPSFSHNQSRHSSKISGSMRATRDQVPFYRCRRQRLPINRKCSPDQLLRLHHSRLKLHHRIHQAHLDRISQREDRLDQLMPGPLHPQEPQGGGLRPRRAPATRLPERASHLAPPSPPQP